MRGAIPKVRHLGERRAHFSARRSSREARNAASARIEPAATSANRAGTLTEAPPAAPRQCESDSKVKSAAGATALKKSKSRRASAASTVVATDIGTPVRCSR